MAKKKTKKSSPDRTPFDLTEPFSIRLSEVILQKLDWYCEVMTQQEQRKITRPDAVRKLLIEGLRSAEKKLGA